MKFLKPIIILFFFTGGCAASGPTFKDTPFATEPAPSAKGRIIFYRESDRNLSAVTVGVGDAIVGTLARKGFIVAELAPGDYKISGWMRAIPIGESVLRMRVLPGETHYIKVSHRSHRMLYPFVGVLGAALVFADTEGEFRLEQVPATIALPDLAELKLSE
jgi:hypothetical protein